MKKVSITGFDCQTRVLTLNGLKFFRELNRNDDRVATLHPVTQRLEYQPVDDMKMTKYKGTMVRLKNRTFDLLIAPDQPLVFQNHDRSFRIGQIRDEKCGQLRIPQAHAGFLHSAARKSFVLPPVINRFGSSPVTISMDLWVKFLGFYLADGSNYYNPRQHAYCVSLHQKKPKFIEEINQIVEEIPFHHQYRKRKGEWRIFSKQMAEYMVRYNGSADRSFPSFIYSVGKKQKESFLKWIFIGDGKHDSDGRMIVYCTASVPLRDGLLNLLLQLGYRFSIATYDRIGQTRTILGHKSIITRLFFEILLKKGLNYYVRRRSIAEVLYEGWLYNLSVPNGLVLVERNGRFTWCPCEKSD